MIPILLAMMFFSLAALASFVAGTILVRKLEEWQARRRVLGFENKRPDTLKWPSPADKLMAREMNVYDSLRGVPIISEDMPAFPACECHRRIALVCGRSVCRESIISFLPIGRHEARWMERRGDRCGVTYQHPDQYGTPIVSVCGLPSGHKGPCGGK